MSNHLAIATVTAALAQVVLEAAQQAVGGATVQTGRPTTPTSGSTPHVVQLYLYQVSPNGALRNADLPARGGDGGFTRRPQVALDLDYLLAFYGDEATLEPERMLGAVVGVLHAHPVLTRRAIGDAVAGNVDLANSDLADAVERVRFTPVSLSLDELSKLWSVFFQTPHTLSVVYRASVVLIEAEETAHQALPVLRRGEADRGVETLLGPFPRLDGVRIGWPDDADRRLRPPSLPSAQLGLRLVFTGGNLAGERVRVRFAHPRLEVPESLVPVSGVANEITVDLPAADDPSAQDKWAAGLYAVRAIVKGGDTERESNVLPLAFAPRIVKIEPISPIPRVNGDATLTLTCSPRVWPKQSADLLLAGRRVRAEARDAPTDTLTFVVKDAPVVEDVFVRLRVDGVESVPFVRVADPPYLVFDDNQKVSIS